MTDTMIKESGASVAPGASSVAAGAKQPRYYLEILLVSFAGLLLEISYTRVISFKLFYYYTYLVIGLALLGIGAGAVLVAVSDRLRNASTDAVLLWSSLLGGASVAVGYVVIALPTLDTFAIWEYGTGGSFKNVAFLFLICLALCAPFIAVGVVVSTLFSRAPERIGRLYFADLVGAGLACAVVVVLISTIGPPAAIFLAGLVMALAGLRIAVRLKSPGAIPAAAVLSVILAVAVVAPSVLPQQRLEADKLDIVSEDVRFSEWSPIFRIDAVDAVEPNTNANLRLLFHDGQIGSAIYEWNGDDATLDRFQFDSNVRAMAFGVSDQPPEREMIIGAAGGHEILASRYFGADQIDAIELNPVTHRLVTEDFADYAGQVAEKEGVNYVKGDGRTFLARSDEEYGLIWYPAPDSYAATNASTAGAFVLSESYLYTSEAIQESLDHLTPGGIVVAQFGEVDYQVKPNRTTRYVSTARHALAAEGIEDPAEHILVATSPTALGAGTLSTIVVKKEPFTPAEVERFSSTVAGVPGSSVEYAPFQPPQENTVTTVATSPNDQLEAFYESYAYDVAPITDDGPFFWHFKRYGDVIANITDDLQFTDREDTVGERVLLLLLVIAVLLAAAFLLLPFITIRDTWKKLPRKGLSAVYFASLGLGFLLFEITLIQKLVLFLGYPTYSLTVTLASILLFTGVGALLSGRITLRINRLAPVLFGVLAALTAFYLFALGPITDALLPQALALRVVVAFVLLAPLGLCLGMFMPLGLGTVAGLTDHSREYVAWGWAVNGFASVIGSVLTTLLAMAFGFRAVLVVALAVYAIALVVLRVLAGDDPKTADAELEALVDVSEGTEGAPVGAATAST